MLARIIYILKAYHINKLCPKKSNLSIVLCERAKRNVINFLPVRVPECLMKNFYSILLEQAWTYELHTFISLFYYTK